MTFGHCSMSSGWHIIHRMSSGRLSRNWYLIRMSYDNAVMSSGWHRLPFVSHPDEIANFDFPHHAVALQRFRMSLNVKQHWNRYIVILIKFSLLASAEVVKITVQPMIKILSKWQHFCFSECHMKTHLCFFKHDDVIKWKHYRVTGPLCGEVTGPGEFPKQRPVTRSFDVFFDLRLNKRLSKQWWGCWFETPSWSLWRHCSENN